MTGPRNGRRLVLLAAAAMLGGAGRQHASDNHPIVWNFTSGLEGASPRGDLLADTLGNLYGTASVGGAAGDGAVFMVTPSATGGAGTAVSLYSFTGGADGSLPSAGLIADSTGALYGTAALDGAGNGGTVFKLTPPAAGQTAWTETTLWSFGAAGDGRNPVGTLAAAPGGVLYGTTMWGGANGFGTVFKLTPPSGGTGAWQENIIWSFTGKADGANPVAAVAVGSSGTVYGTAKAGGAGGVGTVFQVALVKNSRVETTLWSFTGGSDGAAPSGTLLPDGNGGFFGTAEYGGAVNPLCDQARFPYYGESGVENAPAAKAAYVPPGGNGCGVIFDLSPPAGGGTAWTETIVWGFGGLTDGANPPAGLVAGASGTLYGLASQYGQTFWGSEFRLNPAASGGAPYTLTPVASFDGKSLGFYPRGTPVFGQAGQLYGTTPVGGKSWRHVSNYGYGVVFSSAP